MQVINQSTYKYEAYFYVISTSIYVFFVKLKVALNPLGKHSHKLALCALKVVSYQHVNQNAIKTVGHNANFGANKHLKFKLKQLLPGSVPSRTEMIPSFSLLNAYLIAIFVTFSD